MDKCDKSGGYQRYFSASRGVGVCAHCGETCYDDKMFEHTNGEKTCDDCKDEFAEIIEEE